MDIKESKDLLKEYLFVVKDLQKLKNLIKGYTIIEEIGEGKTGIVFKAIQHSLNRPVAIKFLHPKYYNNHDLITKFLREVYIVGKLDHPNIIKGIDAGEIGEIPYLIMEYIDGITLEQFIKGNGPLKLQEALKLCKEILSALVYLWDRNLVHRDINPRNIMIYNKNIKICDLGLIKNWKIGFSQTTYEFPLKYYAFISPELLKGEIVDFRSDVYSLGAILYYSLVGDKIRENILPLEKDNITKNDFGNLELDSEINNNTIIKEKIKNKFNFINLNYLEELNIHSKIKNLIKKMLSQNPKQRAKNINEIIENFEEILNINNNITNKILSFIKRDWSIYFLIILIIFLSVLFVFFKNNLNKGYIKYLPIIYNTIKNKQLSGSDIYNLFSSSVVIVKTNESLGSGCIVLYKNTFYIITNFHVIKGYKNNIEIILKDKNLKDKKSFKTKLLAKDKKVDLALISLPPKIIDRFSIVPFKLAERIEPGETVYIIGHPKRLCWSVNQGIVSAIRDYLIQIDAKLTCGDSGGAIINKYGKLIGIVRSKIDNTLINFGITSLKIKEFIEEYRKQRKI